MIVTEDGLDEQIVGRSDRSRSGGYRRGRSAVAVRHIERRRCSDVVPFGNDNVDKACRGTPRKAPSYIGYPRSCIRQVIDTLYIAACGGVRDILAVGIGRIVFQCQGLTGAPLKEHRHDDEIISQTG